MTSLHAEFRDTLAAGKPLLVDVHAFFGAYMHARNLALRPRA